MKVKLNILIVGSGGREHALAWKVSQSPRLGQLYTVPGNPGTARCGTNLLGDPYDLEAIAGLTKQHQIDLVVIGPEGPLAAGLSDRLGDIGIPVFGPSQAAARIEASKAFAKDFMARHRLPTAEYQTFTEFQAAWRYLTAYQEKKSKLPVIKASGLAGGKGVFLPETLSEAEDALRSIMVAGKFGKSGTEVVIEERLCGREVSVLAFSDGKTVVPMPPAQDYKRLRDNDKGPNTGGMGVFAPSPYAPPALIEQITTEILQPTVTGLAEENKPYVGVLYAGLILTQNGPKLLEFNCRFGDPETQVILPLLESDLVEVMLACVESRLEEMQPLIRWKQGAALCVIAASEGYPGEYATGFPIRGLDALPEDAILFHAGTTTKDGQPLTAGGRVLGITTQTETVSQARTKAYASIEKVHFQGMQYRRDIGLEPSAYTAAGVNIQAGNEAVSLMKESVNATHGPNVLSGIGSFGGLYAATHLKEMSDPVLVASTDGVGTKVMLAAQTGRLWGIGVDIVNHCINDILVQNARPLFFMDYFASSRLDPRQVAEIVAGMASACQEAGCALLGGESAEMPGVYAQGQFDVAGTIVGVVERSQILPKGNIQPGYLVLGFASSGPHTNGYSLIRRAFADIPLDTTYPELDGSLADALLAPHRSYLPLLADLLSAPEGVISALAHITGGGFSDNIPRVLPDGCGVKLHRQAWPVPPVFEIIQQAGRLAEAEMVRVFNMGVGMVAIVPPEAVDVVRSALNEQFWVIGEVIAGEGVQIL